MGIKKPTYDPQHIDDPKFHFIDSEMEKVCTVDFDFGIMVLLLHHAYSVTISKVESVNSGKGLQFTVKGLVSEIHKLNKQALHESNR